MPIRQRIEVGFEHFARYVLRMRWPAIGLLFGLSLGLASFLPEMRVDNSQESFLKRDDPARIGYDRFQERFGREDTISVMFQPEKIFDLEFLAHLRTIHREIEAEVPYVDEVTSLINARNTRGEGDSLIVEDLTEDWPETEADLRALRARVFSNPLFVNALVSETESLTVIAVRPLTYSTRTQKFSELAGFDESPETLAESDPDVSSLPEYLTQEESSELVDALRVVVERNTRPGEVILVSGGPVIDQSLTRIMDADVARTFGLSMLLILGILYALFRRISGALLPLVVVVASLLGTFGFMALVEIPFSITLNILPALLLTVGICDSIHVLAIVYQRIDAGAAQDEAIVGAIGHSGLAVLMTSLTTAAGLVSFVTAKLTGVAHLGVIAPVGILLAMVYSLILLPALLSVIPLRRRRDVSNPLTVFVRERFLLRLGGLATRRPGAILVASAFVVLVSLLGVSQARFSHDGIRWFPEDDPVRYAAELVDDEFKGTSSLEVVIDTGRENGLHDPKVLARIEAAMIWSEELDLQGIPIEKSTSIVDIVKEINRALNGDRASAYVLPTEQELIAQELLLFENSGNEDLEHWTDSLFQTARLSIRTPWIDSMAYPAFVERVRTGLTEILGEDLPFEMTGGANIFSHLFHAVIISLARSYTIAILVITPLLILLVGNLKRGLLAMIPNLIPIVLTIALTGWLDIPLDASTMLIGGVILGVAVDDTIHFMHKFNRYYEDCGDPVRAVMETLETTGTALLFTSLVLCAGFAVFMTTYLSTTIWFGMLATFATAVAFLADVLVAPALMIWVTPNSAREHDQVFPFRPPSLPR